MVTFYISSFDLFYTTQSVLIWPFILRLFVAVSFSSLPLELLDCDDLHSVIRLVLKAGNYMNAVGILFLFLLPTLMRLLSIYHMIYHSNILFFRVATVPTPLASGWPLCSSWQTPRPTSLAWTSCTTLPKWGGFLGWTDAHWRRSLWNHDPPPPSCYVPKLFHLFAH